MNPIRDTRPYSTARAEPFGLSSALLIAFGSAATLFGSLSLGLVLAAEPAPHATSAARPDELPQPAVEAPRREAAPALAFVPQYSEAVRRRADSAYAAHSVAPASPYSAQAELSR